MSLTDLYNYLSTSTPFTMILRLYSTLVFLWDFAGLILYSIYAVLQSFYEIFKPPPLKPVDNEIVLIVGASRGIGRELAIQLSKLGAEVVCWDINSVGNESTVGEAVTQGGKAHAYTCDVTDKVQVLKMIKKVQIEVGDITMMFHCCGVPSPRSLIEQDTPEITSIVNLSVMSHFWLLEAVLPRMKKMNHGHIVALTSVAGLSGLKNQIPLSVSQFAVQGLIESVSEELRTSKFTNIHLTLAHIYPFIISKDLAKDIRMRIPSFFGRIDSVKAASNIIEGVRRNYFEISIPGYLLCLSHALRMLPRKATFMLRDLFDTGVDFV